MRVAPVLLSRPIAFAPLTVAIFKAFQASMALFVREAKRGPGPPA
jgi:hypothetical protein